MEQPESASPGEPKTEGVPDAQPKPSKGVLRTFAGAFREAVYRNPKPKTLAASGGPERLSQGDELPL